VFISFILKVFLRVEFRGYNLHYDHHNQFSNKTIILPSCSVFGR